MPGVASALRSGRRGSEVSMCRGQVERTGILRRAAVPSRTRIHPACRQRAAEILRLRHLIPYRGFLPSARLRWYQARPSVSSRIWVTDPAPYLR